MDNEDSETGSSSENDSTQNSTSGIESKPLDIVAVSPLLIDNKQIYYQGFLSLSDEDKSRVLLGFLLTNEQPSFTNIEDQNPSSLKERFSITKEDKLFKLKLYGLYGLLVLIIVAAIVVVVMFVYISLNKGVLDEAGALTGILSTIQEVFKVLFSDPSSGSMLN